MAVNQCECMIVRGSVCVVGPSKSSLKAMLDNLDNDEAMLPIQSGAVSPPAHAAANSMVDIHMPDGKYLLVCAQ